GACGRGRTAQTVNLLTHWSDKDSQQFADSYRGDIMKTAILFAALVVISSGASAQTAQQTFDQNMRNANEVSQRLQQEREREQMRDKSHDNRVMINKDTSVGIGNVRTTRGQ